MLVFNFDGSNLNNIVLTGNQASGLKVKEYKFTLKAFILFPCYNVLVIIHQIALNAIQHFDTVFFAQGHHFRVSLKHTVVGDTDGVVAKVIGLFHDFSHLAHCIHGAVLAVKVKLDTLFLCVVTAYRRCGYLHIFGCQHLFV